MKEETARSHLFPPFSAFMPPITRSKAKLLASSQLSNLNSNPSTTLETTIGKKRNRKNMGETKKNIKEIQEISSSSSTLLPIPLVSEESNVENIKKIKLSEEESNLNGAPEGELYDVTVLDDENLTILLNPQEELIQALDILRNTATSWASRHSSIEIIRRACKYHSNLITETILNQSIQECCIEIESLRSCVCRNGLACLKSLYQIALAVGGERGERGVVNSSILEKSIHLLMNKSSGGPKFLCSLMIESLNIGIQLVPNDHLLSLLQPFNSHKNAEISSRSFILVAERCLIINFTSYSSSPSSLQSQYCQYLTNGLHSFRPQSREICKNALLKLFQNMNSNDLYEMIEKEIPHERKTELLRIVDESLKKQKQSQVSIPEKKINNPRKVFHPPWKQSNFKENMTLSSSNTSDSSDSNPSSSSSASLLII